MTCPSLVEIADNITAVFPTMTIPTTENEPRLAAGLVTASRLPHEICPNDEKRPCLRTVRNWTRKKLIPAIKVGGRFYYEPSRVLAALRKFETKEA